MMPNETNPTDPPVLLDWADQRPIHLARCATCDERVRFRPLPSGGGFMVPDPIDHATYGVGEQGRPLCPHGHGEMAIADDGLPAAEAITETAARLGPVQPPLFEPPPFDTGNALTEIFTKRQEMAVFEQLSDDASQKAKRAREDRDEARAALGDLIDHFKQAVEQRAVEIARRRERSEPEQAALTEIAGPRPGKRETSNVE